MVCDTLYWLWNHTPLYTLLGDGGVPSVVKEKFNKNLKVLLWYAVCNLWQETKGVANGPNMITYQK